MSEQEDFDAWNARNDRFDGFDRGDLDNSYDEERQAMNELTDEGNQDGTAPV